MQSAKTHHYRQPRVLYMSFMTAMFERFGYYVIGFLLTLYVKAVYNYSDDQAFGLFAIFTALGYLTPAIGGYIADRLVGIKRCLGLGLLFECAGYAILAIPDSNTILFNLALAFVIIGAGIFKTAPTNILGRAYEKDDPRIDSGFTLYYMGINIGSLGSAIITGVIMYEKGIDIENVKLAGDASVAAFHLPFLFAAIGLFLGFVWFLFFKHYARGLESTPGEKSFSIGKWLLTLVVVFASVGLVAYLINYKTIADIFFYIGSAVVLLMIGYEILISSKEDRVRIVVCLILIFLAVVFFLLYFQLYESMVLFIKRNVDRTVYGLFPKGISPVFYLGLNGLWIIVLSPIFAFLYNALRKVRGKGIAITTKFPAGILIIALAFFSLTLSCRHFAGPDGRISTLWVVFALFLYSAGELLTSALGVAMITRIAPKRVYGIMMGAWFLIATALAAELSGLVASLAAVPEQLQNNAPASLAIYGNAFLKMGLIGLAGAVVGFALSPWLKKKAGIE